MTSISKTQDLLATIRAHALTRPGASSNSPQASPVRTRRDPASLAQTTAQRIAGIGASDPDRRRRAFRYFLEAALADVFGAESPTDPGFQTVLDEVQRAMTQDEALAAAANKVADRLLEGAAGGRSARELSEMLASR